MLPELEKLLVLQDRDQRIATLDADLGRLPLEEEGAKSRLAGDKAALAAVEEKLKENAVAIKNLELDVETRNTTIARLKVQQFETRKNDEYAALGHEIERYGKEVSSLEDRELALMEEAETIKEQRAAAEAALAKTNEVVEKELAIIAERRKQCEAQRAETVADREQIAADIDEDLLDEYGRLFKSKKGAAVVGLAAGTCKGCHMKVVPATNSGVKAGKAIVHCDQCGRILYEED